MKFSEKLQKLRKDNNLSQEALADKLDVSRQSVSKWESGQTYPEMDKLITLCKIFNVTLDDLTNDEIQYKEVKKEKRNPLSNIIDEIMYIIDKTIYIFNDMNKKERKNTILKIITLLIILLLLKIPFDFIVHAGNIMINYIHVSYFLNTLWTLLINIVYITFCLFTFIYTYKTYILEKYTIKEKEQEETENETVTDEVLEEKQKIRKIKIEHEKRDPIVLPFLGKLINIFIKSFVGLITIPFIISYVLLFLSITLLIYCLFKGIIYFGIPLVIISFLIINIIFLKLLISFIFNMSVKFKPLFIIFIISLGICGVGLSISLIEITNTEIIEDLPPTTLTQNIISKEYTIDENLVLSDMLYYNHKINYIKDETLNDKIIVEIEYYSDFTSPYISEFTNNNYKYIDYDLTNKNPKNLLTIIIDNLKDKKLYDYSKLYELKITIYSSSKTYEMLKQNKENSEEIEEQNYEEINEISSLESQINDLQLKIEELENTNETLKNEKEELQNKIEEYQTRIKDLLNN